MPNYRAHLKIVHDFKEEDMRDAHTEADCFKMDIQEEFPNCHVIVETVEDIGGE